MFMHVRATRFRANAFTLVELMVVMTIIVLLSGVMVAEMRGSYEDALLRTSARTVIDLCDTAGSRAISVHQPYVLRFDSASGKYILRPKAQNPDEVGIARETEMPIEGELDTRIALVIREPQREEEPDSELPAAAAERERRAQADVITFYPDGTSDAREFLFRDRAGVELNLRLNPVTGRVRIVEPNSETP
jgi:prepilin-type N-terminal cleavage/methylation domain-containing protein